MKLYLRFDELSPTARRWAIAVHTYFLREYHRFALMLCLCSDLASAGYSKSYPKFEPDLTSLLEHGIQIEGDEVDPQILESLTMEAIQIHEGQIRTEKIESCLRAEDFLFDSKGDPIYAPCRGTMSRYYDGRIFLPHGESMSFIDYLITGFGFVIKDEVLGNIIDDLHTSLSKPNHFFTLDQLDEICRVTCLCWNDTVEDE